MNHDACFRQSLCAYEVYIMAGNGSDRTFVEKMPEDLSNGNLSFQAICPSQDFIQQVDQGLVRPSGQPPRRINRS